jgi:hypothetical protein
MKRMSDNLSNQHGKKRKTVIHTWKCQCGVHYPFDKELNGEMHVDSSGEHWAACHLCMHTGKKMMVRYECCGWSVCKSCGYTLCRQHTAKKMMARTCAYCQEPWDPVLRIKPKPTPDSWFLKEAKKLGLENIEEQVNLNEDEKKEMKSSVDEVAATKARDLFAEFGTDTILWHDFRSDPAYRRDKTKGSDQPKKLEVKIIEDIPTDDLRYRDSRLKRRRVQPPQILLPLK